MCTLIIFCHFPILFYDWSINKQCCGSALTLVGWIRMRIQEDNKWPTEKKKVKKFHILSVTCSILRAEGFSWCLVVLRGGHIWHKKNCFIVNCTVLQFLVIKTLDRMDWPKMLDPDVHWNQCESITLPTWHVLNTTPFTAVLGIRDILVRIRISGSVPLNNGSGSGFNSRPDSLLQWL